MGRIIGSNEGTKQSTGFITSARDALRTGSWLDPSGAGFDGRSRSELHSLE